MTLLRNSGASSQTAPQALMQIKCAGFGMERCTWRSKRGRHVAMGYHVRPRGWKRMEDDSPSGAGAGARAGVRGEERDIDEEEPGGKGQREWGVGKEVAETRGGMAIEERGAAGGRVDGAGGEDKRRSHGERERPGERREWGERNREGVTSGCKGVGWGRDVATSRGRWCNPHRSWEGASKLFRGVPPPPTPGSNNAFNLIVMGHQWPSARKKAHDDLQGPPIHTHCAPWSISVNSLFQFWIHIRNISTPEPLPPCPKQMSSTSSNPPVTYHTHCVHSMSCWCARSQGMLLQVKIPPQDPDCFYVADVRHNICVFDRRTPRNAVAGVQNDCIVYALSIDNSGAPLCHRAIAGGGWDAYLW